MAIIGNGSSSTVVDCHRRDRFLAAGMDDYLPKPFVFEDLLRILARVVGRRPDRRSGLAKEPGQGQNT